MRRVLLIVSAAAVGIASTAAVALTDDPIATRKQLMRANGAAFYGVGQRMIRGEIPFNPIVAQSVFQTTSAVGYSFGDYFPEGSDQGDTRASPRIWEDMEHFQEYLTELRDKSAAALEAEPQTLEAFQELASSLNETCSGCHEDFRLADN
jgi:cytochrome c556